jgi:DNA topoisomerase I
MNQKSLIVVESPSKARTIEQYLDGEFEVVACVGHVKDLPTSKLGIDIENNFEMTLDVLPKRKDFIKELRKKSNAADRVYIASDPDREGEAIASHLASEVPSEKLERVEFNEITKAGVHEGMNNSRKLDYNMINAQKTRRIIDRLVGYKVSPVLWATLQKNMNFVNTTLSAGRVQSACVKIVIERDRKRQKYKKTEYYDLKVELKTNGSESSFEATLNKIDGKKIVSSNDFKSDTGSLKNKNVIILNEKDAKALISKLNDGSWIVKSVDEKPRTSNPKPPFTTSTLQQEAARKLRYSAKNTMSVAQQLYENGFITYMRTDSTHLSKEAVSGSRNLISKLFGNDYLPKSPNNYETNVKNAQEAHEAIRPAHETFKSVETVQKKLGKDAGSLYDLIWKRTIASQMLPSKLKQTAVVISNSKTDFRASGQIIVFPGYMKIYVEGRDNPDAELANKEKLLPNLTKNDQLTFLNILAQKHNTKPPARFTEASLIKEMETNGIGRPSTFASILDTIVRRGYVEKTKSNLSPTYLGLAITQLLENHFTTLVDKNFTAKMENELDAISRGELEPIPFMKNFYFGDSDYLGLEKMLEEKVDIGKACTIPLPDGYDKDIDARIGKFGPYLRKEEDTRSIPQDIYIGDLTDEIIDSLFKEQRQDEILGKDPNSNEDILLKKGPYGHYVQLGESTKRKAIPKGTDIHSVDLNLAIQLISLPRTLGDHPEKKIPITADYGRYGPYLKMDKSNARLIAPATPLTVTLEEAVEMLSKSKKGPSELKSLGNHPDTGEKLVLKEGRYGPYISDGKFNAALKSHNDPNTVTLEEAVELINLKRVAPKRTRKKRRRKK